jgi:hypothetical protein
MRRLRAVLTIAAMWALAWAPIGLALALYAASSPPQPSDVIARPVTVPFFVAAWTVWGALSGAAFAFVLSVAERRRTIESLSPPRTAAWGALGATALPLLLLAIDLASTPVGLRGYGWGFPLLTLSISAGLGGCCAAGTLAIAQRALGDSTSA